LRDVFCVVFKGGYYGSLGKQISGTVIPDRDTGKFSMGIAGEMVPGIEVAGDALQIQFLGVHIVIEVCLATILT
jgi:hypothetical protein